MLRRRPARRTPPTPQPAPTLVEDRMAAAHAPFPWTTRRVFRTAFTAAIALALAYVLVRAIADVASVLVLIALAAVFAVGLDPIVVWLMRRGMRRVVAVTVVAVGFLVLVGGLFAAILPPIISQATDLVHRAPSFAQDLQDQDSSIGRLMTKYHVVEAVEKAVGVKSTGSSGQISVPVNGIIGIGTAVLGTLTSVITVTVLTLYFLTHLPGLRTASYRMVPASRRERVAFLGDEILSRVGGYVLGNVATSVIAGVATFVFAEIVRVPFPLALGLVVAVLDLIPVVGSTIGGIIVSLVALTVSLPVAIASAVFYVVFRLAEDYLLTPKIMNRTVHVSPVLTIVALLIGASLLGIVGAFLAIPAAAAIELLVTEVAWPRLDQS